MKQMKKILIVLMVFLCLSLLGCGTKKQSKEAKEISFTSGATYTYMADEWNLYVGTLLSKDTIKIESWYRFTADDKTPFEFHHDVCTVTTSSNGFKWIGNNNSCFEVSIDDENTLKSSQPVYFTIYDGEIEKIHNKQIRKGTDYGFQHDKWHLYIASKLSDTTIKVEAWDRLMADNKTPFEYKSDVRIIDTKNNDVDFKWLDDGQTSFQITMKDENNSYWEEIKTVSFSLDVDKYIITPSKLNADEETTEDSNTTENTEYLDSSDSGSGDITTGSYGDFEYEIQNNEVKIVKYTGNDTSISIPSDIDDKPVTILGNSLFKDNSSVTQFLIWADIKVIEDYCFSGCSKLEEISISGEATKIGAHAFENCSSLKTVLNWGDPAIGEYAFAGCKTLEEISISADTPKIGAHSFENCINLESALIWGDTPIDDYAFAGCKSLKEISISSGTPYIGAHAFDGCTSLSSALVWGDDTEIKEEAFANCPNLKDVPK